MIIINLLHSKGLFSTMQQYMFSKNNMLRGYNAKEHCLKYTSKDANVIIKNSPHVALIQDENLIEQMQNITSEEIPARALDKKTIESAFTALAVCNLVAIDVAPFTPYNKDKLFWCIYIFIYGYEEYELNRSNAFSVEKRIKIETVEHLKSIKDKLKELKLKRTELETELVHQPCISVKGLYALCLIHDVSVTYIAGRKYSILNPDATKKCIIIRNGKNEDSLRWSDGANDEAFHKKIQEDYWYIENIQKPLKAPSAYSLKEIQDICSKLQIDLYASVNEKQKQKLKTKTTLYQEILQYI